MNSVDQNMENHVKQYFLIFVALILLILGQIFAKMGSDALSIDNFNVLDFFNFFIILGYTCLILQGLVWIFVLRQMDLSFAYPFMSISYVLVLIFSYFIFNEAITGWKIIGSSLMTIGVAIIYLGERGNKND